MSEHRKSRVTAVRSAEVEIPSSSSVMEISIGGANRAGGGFSTGAESLWEADMTESELEEGQERREWEEVRDSVLILADDDEDEDEMLLPDIDGDNAGTPPPVDPLLVTLVVVAVESRLEDVLFIESLDNLLSLDADERNKRVSSSVIGDGPTGSGGSGVVGGNVGGGFGKTEEVEGVEAGGFGMNGVRGEGGMKEGGAGNDSRSSGTITDKILGGCRVDMGWRMEGGRRGVCVGWGGNGRWDERLGFDGVTGLQINTTDSALVSS